MVEISLPETKPAMEWVNGRAVVFLVDTAAQTVTARTKGGERIFAADENLTDSALPGFSMPVKGLFTEPRPRGR